MHIDILEIQCAGSVVFVEDVDLAKNQDDRGSFRFMRQIAIDYEEGNRGDGLSHVKIVLPDQHTVRQRFGRLQAKHPLHVAGRRHLQALNTKCEDTTLPKYVKKVLTREGILHVHQPVRMSETQMLDLEGFGPAGYQHFVACIKDLGLQHPMDLTSIQDQLA